MSSTFISRRQTWIPWTASALAHAAVVALAVRTTIGISHPGPEPPVQMLLAPFDTTATDPVSHETLDTLRHEDTDTASTGDPIEPLRVGDLGNLRADEPEVSTPAPASHRPRLRPSHVSTPPRLSGGAPVSFAGVTSRRASKVAFVIDASGSMIGSLPAVIDELERSLRRMDGEQRFRILFFQRNSAVEPPPGRLLAATKDHIDQVLGWARSELMPAGRSNPLAALEAALKDRPDVIFLMSTPVTGAGEFEMSADEILARIDSINSPGEAGRAVQIQCIQLLDDDPDETLKRIAERHGGPGAFRFVSRADLGLLAGE